ncbi:MAG: PD-(D/E)XK nuclease family protein [Gammaproteobacteria bacterium]|nr:PD-(D/E)XK nuclease family protein [Gammaproteobacteria bacterium]
MPILKQSGHLIKALTQVPDSIVITANRRLANCLRQDFDHHQRQAQKLSWESPNILPLTTWLQLSWQQLQKPAWVLSNFQEHCLWQQIIQQYQTDLLDSQQTAKLAAQAWKLLADWELNITDLKPPLTNEAACFYQWAVEFTKRCENLQCISHADIPHQLIKELKRINWPIQLITVGFSELTPIYKSLFTELEQFCQIIKLQADPIKTDCQQVAAATPEAELENMLNWAKSRLNQHPQSKLGLIIPDLEKCRAQVNAACQQLLNKYQLPGEPLKNPWVNLSAGQNLTQSTVIQHALAALNLQAKRLELAKFSQLWQSPYLNPDDQEQNFAALIDRELRELDEPEINHSNINAVLAKLSQQHVGCSWPQRWHQFLRKIKQLPRQQMPSQWSKHFSELLSLIGWPGGRDIVSIDYQLIQRWQNLLAEFCSLDCIFQNITYSKALQLLTQFAGQTVFQAEGSSAPIQVLGLLEATGLEFDAIWICRLQADNWPPVANPNPLLPFELQKQQKMPHSSALRELEYAKNIFKLICEYNSQVIVSYAKEQQDKNLLPSPLIINFPKLNITPSQLKNENYIKDVPVATKLEYYQDEQAPSVKSMRDIKGGSWILTQQANCPFQAFANIRLHANALPEPNLNISPLLRGILTHQALEDFWQEVKSQKNLIALNDETLKQKLNSIIYDAIEQQSIANLSDLSQALLQLEQNRLVELLFNWLQFEKTRPAFKVLDCEVKQQINFCGLKLTLKIDRIDQLSDGKQLVIDYKTGSPSVYGWFDERLSDPQLPLYCLTENKQQYAGLSFAQVKLGDFQFKGVLDNHATVQEFSKLKTLENYSNYTEVYDWPSLLNGWRDAISALANEFMQGVASVTPHENACDYCDLQALCRVDA